MIYNAIYSFEVYISGSWTDVSSSILSIEGSSEATINRDNGLAFGDSSELRVTAHGTLGLQSLAWQLTPFRATFQMDADIGAIYGVITERDRTLQTVDFTCEGYAALIRDTKAYSPPFYRKPVATKTTATSIEDPTDPAYVAGPINWTLWQAGGRPLEQDFTYGSPAFYYSCDQALLAPDWAWIAGENGWDEALKLVQASGGQLYQNPNGTIVFRQPFEIAEGSVVTSYTTSNFKDIKEHQANHQTLDKAIISYIPRVVRPMQDVAEDTTSRLIQAGETISFDLEPKWPLYTLEQASAGQLKSTAIVIGFLGGGVAVLNTDFSHTVDSTAAKIGITITNLTARPMALFKITLRGQPITPEEAGNASAGTGTKIKTVADGNPYIQSKHHAERLANLYLAFYASSHPYRTISGVVYDPTLEVGDLVNLTVAAWSLSAVTHVIAAIKHSQTGAEMELDLVEIAGLQKTSDFFVVGVDYSASGAKYLVY